MLISSFQFEINGTVHETTVPEEYANIPPKDLIAIISATRKVCQSLANKKRPLNLAFVLREQIEKHLKEN